jgi:Rieske Fe-S protein
MPSITRRSILKMLVAVSAALVIAPLATVARYLNIPYVFQPVKAQIEGAASMPNNSSLDFQWPTQTRPFDTNLLVRDDSGNYHAFNRVCTHLQCFVNYDPESETIQCPCHGSAYDPGTGAVISGPAPNALPEIVLEEDANGNVYALNAVGAFGVGRIPRRSADREPEKGSGVSVTPDHGD